MIKNKFLFLIPPQFKMILLIGINTNFIKYPTTPIIANPTAQDKAIFLNSIKH